MRKAAWALGILGALFLVIAIVWFGYQFYVLFVVTRSPATVSIIKTSAGEQRLGSYSGGHQVVASGATPRPLASNTEGDSTSASSPPTTATPEQDRPILPPTRLTIAKIDLDAPVVLADNDNLPKFKGVGWYIGSGYPGFRGNVVLFGHVNGQYEVFARLNELTPGDEVTVTALDRTYRYIVKSTQEVPKEAVEVMAPTSDRRLTLITCVGTFYPDTRDYSHRLVVVASLD